MFLVGGGILVHGTPGVEGFIHHLTDAAGKTGGLLLAMLVDGVAGVAAGGVVVALVAGYRKVRGTATA
jgi:predicted DNA repair protein MutK